VAIKFDTAAQALQTSMDLRLKRQSLLTGNLVNIDTPHYKPVDMKFEGFLTDAVGGAQTSKEAGEIETVREGVESLDGNGVDLDSQMVKLSDNAARYNVAMELMRRKIAIMRYATSMGTGA